MIYIDYKNETSLITKLLKDEQIEKIKTKNFFNKLISKKIIKSDVYFHYGVFDKNSIKHINASKKVIVSSLSLKKELLKHLSTFDESNIHVLYPSINESILDKKVCKATLAKTYNFSPSAKIILFTAKNFKKNGVKDFLDITDSLKYKNIQIIIQGSKEEIRILKSLSRKKQYLEHILFLEDYKNMSFLYAACDIFLLPTTLKVFSRNVLKAMYHKCAVFVCQISSSCEILDVFSSLSNGSDAATSFKMDAVLNSEEELSFIQNKNHEDSLEFLEEKQILKAKTIVFQKTISILALNA